jgi:molybdate transport system substrate-binding protein
MKYRRRNSSAIHIARTQQAVRLAALLVTGSLCLLTSDVSGETAGARLLAFVGSAGQPAMEEIIRVYKDKTGVQVDAVYGGSGYVLSQMKLTQQGDIYFPGSSDFMDLAVEQGLVKAETAERVAYLAPAILVFRGNPKQIRGLEDLARSDVRVAIADPEHVCVGLYAVEIFEKAVSTDIRLRIRRNLVNYTASCEKTATAVSLRQADAVIGWSVFAAWDPSRIEVVPLPPNTVQRIGYLTAAESRFCTRSDEARRFLRFLVSDEARQIFSRHGYFATPEEAFAFVGDVKPIGGTYALPESWKTR